MLDLNMNNSLPLVTIITPAYNRASFLEETIQSILSQDYPHIEYIVLDDGSTDNTLQILEKYRGRIILESHPNMGEARTVNKGLSMAKGDIVSIVNSDDPLLPGAVRTSVAVLQEYPDALASYPDWNEIGPHSELIQKFKLHNYDIQNMLMEFSIGMGPGVFIRRHAIEKFGVRDTRFKYVGDLDLWLRLASNGKLIHIPQVLATHRIHPDSASVTDRGPLLAGELIDLVDKIYAQPNLIAELIRAQNHVLSQAHYVAAYYCGSDRAAKIRHLLRSVQLDPLEYSPLNRQLYIRIAKLILPPSARIRIRNLFSKER